MSTAATSSGVRQSHTVRGVCRRVDCEVLEESAETEGSRFARLSDGAAVAIHSCPKCPVSLAARSLERSISESGCRTGGLICAERVSDHQCSLATTLNGRDDSPARLAVLRGSALVRLSCAGPGPLAALADRRVDRGPVLRLLVLRDGLGPWRGGCLSRTGQGETRIRQNRLFPVRAGDGRGLDTQRGEICPLSRMGSVDRARSVRLGSRVRIVGVESALAGIADCSALGRAVVVLLIPDLRGERGLDLPAAPVALPRRRAGITRTLGPARVLASRRRDAVAGSRQPGAVRCNPATNGEESA